MSEGEVESALDFNCGGCKYFYSYSDCAHGETVKVCRFIFLGKEISNWQRKIPIWCPIKTKTVLYCPKCESETNHAIASLDNHNLVRCMNCDYAHLDLMKEGDLGKMKYLKKIRTIIKETEELPQSMYSYDDARIEAYDEIKELFEEAEEQMNEKKDTYVKRIKKVIIEIPDSGYSDRWVTEATDEELTILNRIAKESDGYFNVSEYNEEYEDFEDFMGEGEDT